MGNPNGSHYDNTINNQHTTIMLLLSHTNDKIECGCDEAGRGCLAGPVFAAAVVLPDGYQNSLLNDSKQLTERQRSLLRPIIERDATAWAVASVSAEEIDRLNILKASLHAMNLAVRYILGEHDLYGVCGRIAPHQQPELLLIDGNRFYNETPIPHLCIVKGDGKYMSIAAASILAKTHRDAHMQNLHALHPQYGWNRNKGYPTKEHYAAIKDFGATECHRKSFKLVKCE